VPAAKPANKSLHRTAPAPRSGLPLAIVLDCLSARTSINRLSWLCAGVKVASGKPSLAAAAAGELQRWAVSGPANEIGLDDAYQSMSIPIFGVADLMVDQRVHRDSCLG
jgi:hypothetical protein